MISYHTNIHCGIKNIWKKIGRGRNTKLKKEYRLSRWIITIFMIGICQIMFINEDVSVKVVGTALFTIATFLGSCLGTRISRKMIEVGDSITNNMLRILYYIILVPGFMTLVGLIYVTMNAVFDVLPHSNDMGTAVGEAVLFALLMCSVIIFVIIPYIQSLIILLIQKILTKRTETV